MKLIRCTECGDPVALSKEWRNCYCGLSGGQYLRLGLDRAVVAGPCGLYGIGNRLFRGETVEAYPYDESNDKIVRLAINTGFLPERLAPRLPDYPVRVRT